MEHGDRRIPSSNKPNHIPTEYKFDHDTTYGYWFPGYYNYSNIETQFSLVVPLPNGLCCQ